MKSNIMPKAMKTALGCVLPFRRHFLAFLCILSCGLTLEYAMYKWKYLENAFLFSATESEFSGRASLGQTDYKPDKARRSMSLPTPESIQTKNETFVRFDVKGNWSREEVIARLVGNASQWRYRPARIQQFRRQLQESLAFDPRIFAVMHHGNTKIGHDVEIYARKDDHGYRNVRGLFLDVLPERSPFEGRTFRTCSVVGSAAVVTGRRCGKQIDGSDFVFRMNDAPTSATFAGDVGSFTNVTSLNGGLLSIRKASCLQSHSSFAKNVNFNADDLPPLQMVRLPASFVNQLVEKSLRGCRVMTKGTLIFGNPEFVRAANSFWGKNGNNKNISGGLYMLTLALSLCERTHVYGFWPFGESPEGDAVRYHYYNNAGRGRSHSFSAEFGILMALHEQRIIKLHVEHCASGMILGRN